MKLMKLLLKIYDTPWVTYQPIKKIINKIIRYLFGCYKSTLSPILKYLFGGGCRFKPTCSEYSVAVIEKYGIIKGGLLSFKRILSCNNLLK